MNRPLHVHHLITKLELGGAQQNTLYCVEHHDRRAYRVSLGAGPGGVLDADAKRIPRLDLRWFPHLRREVRPVDDLAFLVEFRAWLVSARVDILHTHSSKAGMLGRIAAAMAGTPVVIHTVHGWGFHDFQPMPVQRVYIGLERAVARATDLLFAVSRENRDRGLAAGIGSRSQYRIVRSGIPLAAFARPRRSRAMVLRALRIPAGAPVVGTVGNFKAQKAPMDFIRAAARIARRVPAARFVMVGDGEQRAEAERLAGSLGLAGRVTFTGWRRDIPDLLHAFDVFALSSLFEGLPRSVLQAAAAGLPVVATDANGTPEAVDEGRTGYVVPRGDAAALADRVVALLRDPARARAFGRAGRAFIGQEFEIRRMLAQIESEYRTIWRLKRGG